MEKTTLYNEELEKAIIGHVVNSVEYIIEKLKPEYFHKEDFKKITTAAKELGKFDIIMLQEKTGMEFETLQSYAEYYAEYPVLTNHVERLIETYKNRMTYSLLQESINQIGTTDLNEIADKIDEINKSDRSKKIETMKESMDRLRKDLNEASDPEKIDSMRTGLPTLDSWMTTIESGDLILIGAKSSTGKTALAIQIMHRLVRKKQKVLFFSLEMTKMALLKRTMRNLHEFDNGKLKIKNFTMKERDAIDRITAIMETYDLIIETEISTIREMNSLIREHKPDVVLVDYIQLMDPEISKSNREQEVSNISKGLRKITQRTLIPIIALTQFNAAFHGRPYSDVPIRESKAPYHDADKVIYLYKPESEAEIERYEQKGYHSSIDYKMIEIILDKNREGETGSFMTKYYGKKLIFQEYKKEGE